MVIAYKRRVTQLRARKGASRLGFASRVHLVRALPMTTGIGRGSRR